MPYGVRRRKHTMPPCHWPRPPPPAYYCAAFALTLSISTPERVISAFAMPPLPPYVTHEFKISVLYFTHVTRNTYNTGSPS